MYCILVRIFSFPPTPHCPFPSLTVQVRFRANWLLGIGLFFFMLNICLFIMNCVLISYRFYLRPGSFTRSFTDQVESLFIPAFVSFEVILISDEITNWTHSLSRKPPYKRGGNTF